MSQQHKIEVTDDDARDSLENPAKQYTVFLVEDDPDDTEYAIRILKKSPYVYNIHCFETGDELIGHFITEGYYSGNLVHHLPFLVMLDVHIPGASGLDTLKAIKAHPLTRDIPVIVLTGDLSSEVAENACESQANAFVTKPLHLESVHEVILNGEGEPYRGKPR